MVVFASVAGGALLVGLVLVRLGLRGRAIDDHPVCRSCGRDLFGLDPRPLRCVECGKATRGNVRVGNRRRRRGLIYGGAAVSVAALLSLMPLVSSSVLVGDFQQYKPLWLLSFESRSSASAAGEIVRRHGDGTLTAEQLDGVVARWLEHQADAELPWITKKGDLLLDLLENGKLAPADGQRFIDNAIRPVLEVRPRARSGGELPIWIGGEMRGGTTPLMQGPLGGPRPPKIPVVLSLVRDGERHAAMYREIGNYGGISHDSLSLANVPPGEYGLAIEYEPAGWRRKSQLLGDPRPVPAPLLTIEVAPADEPTAVIVRDDAAAEQLRARVDVEHSILTPGTRARRSIRAFNIRQVAAGNSRSELQRWDLTIQIAGPAGETFELSHDLAYAVLLIDPRDGREVGAGTMSVPVRPIVNWGNHFGNAFSEPFDGDRLDIILRPSVEVAESTPFAFEILGGDTVFEDVAVAWDGHPTTAPK